LKSIIILITDFEYSICLFACKAFFKKILYFLKKRRAAIGRPLCFVIQDLCGADLIAGNLEYHQQALSFLQFDRQLDAVPLSIACRIRLSNSSVVHVASYNFACPGAAELLDVALEI